MSIDASDGYKRFRAGVFKILAFIIIVPIVGLGVWTWASIKFVYASGERSGFVQKFSKKGWLCKTWEGELAMVNLPGAMPEIFEFTVRDERIVGSIEKSMGQRVALHYEQHRGIPFPCFGDTEYFVTTLMHPDDSAGSAPAATPPEK